MNTLKINLSVQARIFLDKLRVIALGEFIPYEWLTKYLREKWRISVDSMDKLGSMAFIVGGILCFACLVVMIGKILKKLGYS